MQSIGAEALRSQVTSNGSTIAPWRVAETFQFRVRAWSDGGVSGYSNVVMSGSARKHRAARR